MKNWFEIHFQKMKKWYNKKINFLKLIGYVISFIVIMCTFLATGLWRDYDLLVYKLLPGTERKEGLSKDIIIVDIPYSYTKETFRKTVAALLDELNRDEDAPKGIALDIAFLRGEKGIEHVIKSIDRLMENKKKIPVFAAIVPSSENDSNALEPDFMNRHDENLYTAHVEGFGHTSIHRGRGTLFYETYLELPRSSLQIPFLATKIAENLFDSPLTATSELRLIHPVDDEAIKKQTFTFKVGCSDAKNCGWFFFSGKEKEKKLTERPSFGGKVVIVGCLKHDIDSKTKIPGPVFIASALNGYILLAGNQINYSKVPTVLHFITFIIPLIVTLLVFISLVHFGNKISISPFLLALVSGIAGLIFVAALIGLPLLMKHFNPYATLPICGVLLSATLAGLYWHGLLWERALMKNRDLLINPPAHKYDIYISYSHHPPENIKWVKENIVNPLRSERKYDGKKLSVFFDKDSIKSGDRWLKKMSMAIYLSEFFLAVYSENYFDIEISPWCDDEIDHANHIAVSKKKEKKKFIMAVLNDLPPEKIPKIYKRHDYVDAKEDPKFLNEIIAKLTANPHDNKTDVEFLGTAEE